MSSLYLLNTELNSSLTTGNLLFQSWFVVGFLLIIAFSKDDVKKGIGNSKN